jgi:hypothetical protein
MTFDSCTSMKLFATNHCCFSYNFSVTVSVIVMIFQFSCNYSYYFSVTVSVTVMIFQLQLLLQLFFCPCMKSRNFSTKVEISFDKSF